jgi:hypothetical protein
MTVKLPSPPLSGDCWSTPTIRKSAAAAPERRYRLHRKRATMSMP